MASRLREPETLELLDGPVATMATLDVKDMLLIPGDPTLPYKPNNPLSRGNRHAGQLKLGIWMMYFMAKATTEMARRYGPDWREGRPRPVVISAGAASGQTMTMVYEAFPEFNYHLWDTSPFWKQISLLAEKMKNDDEPEIVIHKKYIYPADMEAYNAQFPGRDMFFISDIRTTAASGEPARSNIVADNELQYQLVKALNPRLSMLKFRLAYPDMSLGQRDEYFYLPGTVWKQPYAPPGSTETRLIVRQEVKVIDGVKTEVTPDKTHLYSETRHEQQMSYHNNIVRPKQYINPVSGRDTRLTELIPNSWDGVMTLHIFIECARALSRGEDVDFVSQGLSMLSKFVDDLTATGYATRFKLVDTPMVMIRIRDNAYYSESTRVMTLGRERAPLPQLLD